LTSKERRRTETCLIANGCTARFRPYLPPIAIKRQVWMESRDMTAKVVVVGGGYAGAAVARTLDRSCEVTLIDQRDAFVHNVALIRAMVDPTLLERIVFPFAGLLKQGCFVKGQVQSIDQGGVTLADGSRHTADFIVLATGSRYAAPFKLADGHADPAEAIAAAHSRITESGTIAVIGTGAVGIELAGEIRHAWPDKTVVLAGADARLFPGYPRKLHDRMAGLLDAAGVHLVLRQRFDAAALGSNGPIPITLPDGRSVVADSLFVATGSRPRVDLLATLPGARPGPDGRIVNDDHLRPSQMENVFALGDAVQSGDAMTIVGATRQAGYLGKTIAKLARGANLATLPAYRPWKMAPIIVPFGPDRGATFIPLGKGGMVLGNRTTATLKGRDLFIGRYAGMFGAKR
jgi:apoptosis-inducing factor 2